MGERWCRFSTRLPSTLRRGGLCWSVRHYSTELYGVIENHHRQHRESIESAHWDLYTQHIDDTYTWCDILNFMCCWWISSGLCLFFFGTSTESFYIIYYVTHCQKRAAAVLLTLRARRTKYVSRCKHSKCWYFHPNSLFSPLLLLPMILSMIFDVYKYLMSSLRFFPFSFTPSRSFLSHARRVYVQTATTTLWIRRELVKFVGGEQQRQQHD